MKTQKQNQPIQQSTSAGMSVRLLYHYFSIPFNRKMMLNKIDKGLKHEYTDLPYLDKTEDEISIDVLTNWRSLDKKSRIEYCQYILDNSVRGQTWAFEHVEQIKQKFKSQIEKIKRGVNPFKK